MASEFPRSPRVMKGGLVAYRLPSTQPLVIAFQYNPDEVSRSLQSPGAAGGGGRGETNRVNGPPQETLTFSVEIDAADHWKLPHHGRTPGERQPVLVIHRGVRHRNDNVAVHQIVEREVRERGLLARVILGDQEGLESVFHAGNFHG